VCLVTCHARSDIENFSCLVTMHSFCNKIRVSNVFFVRLEDCIAQVSGCTYICERKLSVRLSSSELQGNVSGGSLSRLVYVVRIYLPVNLREVRIPCTFLFSSADHVVEASRLACYSEETHYTTWIYCEPACVVEAALMRLSLNKGYVFVNEQRFWYYILI